MAVAAESMNEGEVRSIAAMLMMPKLAPVIRMRNQFTTQKTVVVRPWFRAALQWDASRPSPPTGANLLAPYQESWWIQRRDMLLAYIKLTKAYGAGLTATWNWVFQRVNGIDNLVFRPMTSSANNGAVPVRPMAAVLAAGSAPHDSRVFAIQGGGRRGQWVDQNTVITFTWSGAASSTSGMIQPYRYIGGGQWSTLSSISYAAASTTVATASFTTPGYYSFDIANNAGETGGPISGFTVTAVTTYAAGTGQDIAEHHCMPGILSNLDNIEGWRTLAHSMLTTRVCSDTSAEGTVLQRQSPKQIFWQDQVMQGGAGNMYQNLASAEGTVRRPWRDGAYSWAKVSDQQDLEMRSPLIFGAGQVGITYSDSFVDFDNPYGDYLVTYMSCTLGSTSVSGTGGDAVIEGAWAAEFRTDNDFFDEDEPSVLAGSWRGALEASCTAIQHHANKIHLGQIFETIGKIARASGPILSMFAHPYAKAAGAILSGVGGFEENVRKRGWGHAFGNLLG